MQTVNLTKIIDPANPVPCVVAVPDGYALAQVPAHGRGSLARWLAGLPNGTTLTARGTKLAKIDGHFVDLGEAEREALIERRWRAVA